ncbi:MAG TPA: TylF/MycF/NovP-related O-methyltransferase, partial [Parvibaculum sp.]
MRVQFRADGLGVKGKNLGFLENPRFAAAWETARQLNAEAWNNDVPDIRWRAHTCCWAATQAMHIEGDFVECGVHGGLLSLTVANFLGFAGTGRNFWLFDTFAGIPLEQLAPADRPYAEQLNKDHHHTDIFDIATRNFSPFPNARLVRGLLPGTLAGAEIKRIAYLSMDLNNAPAEL